VRGKKFKGLLPKVGFMQQGIKPDFWDFSIGLRSIDLHSLKTIYDKNAIYRKIYLVVIESCFWVSAVESPADQIFTMISWIWWMYTNSETTH
jgi:hypothetical protein